LDRNVPEFDPKAPVALFPTRPVALPLGQAVAVSCRLACSESNVAWLGECVKEQVILVMRPLSALSCVCALDAAAAAASASQSTSLRPVASLSM